MEQSNISLDGRNMPRQPGFQFGKYYYLETISEWNTITQSEAIFYQFKTDKESSKTIQVIPNACFDILFCCDPQKSKATFYGKCFESRKIYLEPGCDYFGFRPHSERSISKKLSKPYFDLVNREVPLDEIINCNELIEKICEGKLFEERIGIFQDFAKDYLTGNEYSSNLANNIYKSICLSLGNLDLNKLYRYTGYSEPYIRRKFKQFYGISPKRFSQIVRFQKATQMLINSSDYELSDVVYEGGFYDHAHLDREFKNFNSASPSVIKRNLQKYYLY